MQADLVIVGSGPVGLCAALALQGGQRRIVVLESNQKPEGQPQGLNARSIALAGSTVRVFRSIGVWQQLQAHATPMSHEHVSTKGQFGVTRLQADEVGVDALGYVIESNRLVDCLLTAVEAAENVEIEFGASVDSLQQNSENVLLEFQQDEKQRSITSQLCMIADGARSRLRHSLGIDVTQVDYAQSLIICNAEVSKPVTETAYERFTDQGPLAMLPLGGNRYACVWTMAPELEESRMAASDEAFISELQDCFGMRLGYIERVGERASTALYRTSSQQLTAGRCLLLGNAANALHPVAGQSYNLSIRDVATLQELITDDVDLHDQQQVEVLMEIYQSNREREQKQVIRYSDTLVSLFSNSLSPVRKGRGAGLALLDLFNPLKTHLAFIGMGLAFGGNPLLRGKQ